MNAAALLVDELRLKAELAVLQREKADGEWLSCGYTVVERGSDCCACCSVVNQ